MIRKRGVCFIIWVSLLLIFVQNSSLFAEDRNDVDSFTCNGEIVNIGDTKSDVREKCGEPTSLKRESWEYEVWFYDFGSGTFVYYLEFVGDKIERIQSGGYGS